MITVESHTMQYTEEYPVAFLVLHETQEKVVC